LIKRITLLNVALIALLFLLSYPAVSKNTYGGVLFDRVVAIVNEEVITWSELRRMIELEGKEFLKGKTGEEREREIKRLENSFLNDLINMKLQLQEARRIGLSVSESEVNEAISEIKRKYHLTDEALLNSLKAEGFTLEEYRTRLAEQILLSKVVNFEVKNSIVISDKEIDEYYEANKEKYKGKEKVRIRQIFFALPEDESQRALIEAKAEEIVKRLEEGEDFAELASKFSEDPSREFGGDLGYVSHGSILKEIEDIAFGLKKGEISKPFWSSKGLHIIKVEDKIDPKEIKEVREEIKEILFKKAFRLKYDEWIKELRERAYIEIKVRSEE